MHSHQEITTTATHPFYVESRGFTPAWELHEGDQLRTPDGDTVEVQSIQSTGRRQTVYNIEVEGLHNYHVATDSQTWVLVHNNGCPDDLPNDTMFHYTDAAGSAGIAETGVIQSGMKGRVHLTDEMYSPEEAANALFIGAPSHAGRGDHVVMLRVPEGTELIPGSMPNEVYTQGSLRPEEVIYNGPNPF